MNPLGIRGLALTADEESSAIASRQAMPQCKVQQLAYEIAALERVHFREPPYCASLEQISLDHWGMVRATRVENMVEAATVTPNG